MISLGTCTWCLGMLCTIQGFHSSCGKTSYQPPGPHLNIKTAFPRYGIPMLKIRRSRDRLIVNMGIPILVRWHLNIETASRSHKLSKQRDMYLEPPRFSTMWQAPRQHCNRYRCQIAQWCDHVQVNLVISRFYEILWQCVLLLSTQRL